MKEFSHVTRRNSLERFRSEEFDLLIIGGGITGAACARDATSRGLRVALVERKDFAYGTSSRSSKLIHGGLRYLENREFHLVFEALSERHRLLKTSPNLVSPMPFYMPLYQGSPHGRPLLSAGMWLYDLLALFRTPGFHRHLSRKEMIQKIPFIRQQGLKGGFNYFDASMWDDLLCVETLRRASHDGAAVANYVEAGAPIWRNEKIIGFRLKDAEHPDDDLSVYAKKTIVCAGPWTDEIGRGISRDWKSWLKPSKGIHLVIDLKRLPLPGAVVMSEYSDGRIAFAIPRADYGQGVVIVGTTDAATDPDPDKARVSREEIAYLLSLLSKYFPDAKITEDDIVSTYVGVRPLMNPANNGTTSLQKVSREHHIGQGPGGTIAVAGGKYTTHRTMAAEIIDVALSEWRQDAANGKMDPLPEYLKKPDTKGPVSLPGESRKPARGLASDDHDGQMLSELAYQIQHGMVMHLDDFVIRRSALYLTRRDHGLSLARDLGQVLSRETGRGTAFAESEVIRLQNELSSRNRWRQKSKDNSQVA